MITRPIGIVLLALALLTQVVRGALPMGSMVCTKGVCMAADCGMGHASTGIADACCHAGEEDAVARGGGTPSDDPDCCTPLPPGMAIGHEAPAPSTDLAVPPRHIATAWRSPRPVGGDPLRAAVEPRPPPSVRHLSTVVMRC